jgi:hypothetical protein
MGTNSQDKMDSKMGLFLLPLEDILAKSLELTRAGVSVSNSVRHGHMCSQVFQMVA